MGPGVEGREHSHCQHKEVNKWLSRILTCKYCVAFVEMYDNNAVLLPTATRRGNWMGDTTEQTKGIHNMANSKRGIRTSNMANSRVRTKKANLERSHDIEQCCNK